LSEYRSGQALLEVPMRISVRFRQSHNDSDNRGRRNWWLAILITILPLILPLAAYAQVGGSPFDTGFTALQTLFTGTVAKVASLIAIVIGGYGFAHGEPGAKKALAGVAAGTGIAVLAVNVLSWLWGV
jgi:type IV secretory pathway VirB2 component (pilin)